MKDDRDPEKLGTAYLTARKLGNWPIEECVNICVPNYQNGRYISADPKDHHSKTPQGEGDLTI